LDVCLVCLAGVFIFSQQARTKEHKMTEQEAKQILKEIGERKGALIRGMAKRLIEDIEAKGYTETMQFLVEEFLIYNNN
jgi:hypothetical protein